MSTKSAELVVKGSDPTGRYVTLCLVINDPDLLGKDYHLNLRLQIDVLVSDGIDRRETIHEKSISLRDSRFEYEFLVPRERLPHYTYYGETLNIRCTGELRRKGIRGVVSAIELPLKLNNPKRSESDDAPDKILEPEDKRKILQNLQVLSAGDQLQAIVLLAVAGIVILINTIIGIHDQFTPNEMSWLYTEGRRTEPLASSLAGSGAFGVSVFIKLKSVLRRYMTFRLVRRKHSFVRGVSYPLSEIISGRSRVKLENAELRIVAANIERGTKRGHTKNGLKKTVKFSHIARAVTVYRKRLPVIEADVSLSTYLQAEAVNFERAFDALYPPHVLDERDYGVDFVWEVQLLHPQLTDQELVGSAEDFDRDSFFPNTLVGPRRRSRSAA